MSVTQEHDQSAVESALPSRTTRGAMAGADDNDVIARLANTIYGDVAERRMADDDDNELEDYGSHDDAQSLICVSLSRAPTQATSFSSPVTGITAPQAEISDSQVSSETKSHQSSPSTGHDVLVDVRDGQAEDDIRFRTQDLFGDTESSNNGLTLPSPWHAGPRALIINTPEPRRSSILDVLLSTKARSLSGSGEALKKFLPSLPNVGSFLPNLPFANSHAPDRVRDQGKSPITEPQDSMGMKTEVVRPVDGQSMTTVANIDNSSRDLRRVTSDQSLLYNSLSRASSLGDDARFENNHEMVNSRMKAIRDSFQDRSSFRMPNMPNMPNMPSMPSMPNMPNIPNILPGIDKKKRTSAIQEHRRTTPNVANSQVAGTRAEVDVAPDVAEPIRADAFEKAILDLKGDVVIMGGYRGSILRSSKPPHRQLWVPVKVGLNIRKVNLEVGLHDDDEQRMEESIYASGMLQHIGPVDISRRLIRRLRDTENAKNGSLRIWDYGYDWRLSPHLLSEKLVRFLEGLPSNRIKETNESAGALVIAHSLGGLITRHAVNRRPELFSGVIYGGVPQSCVNILGPLRNGDAVLLSSRVLTAQVNFTLRTSFALLPLEGYCFVDKTTKEEITVDFFNPDDWIRYRWSPCTDPPLPPANVPSPALFDILKTRNFNHLPLTGKRDSIASTKRLSQVSNTSAMYAAAGKGAEVSTAISPQRAVDATQPPTSVQTTLSPQMDNMSNPVSEGKSINSSVSTTVTIPRADAIAYLRRVLPQIKRFKLELAHNAEHAASNRYPPLATIYCKSIPTVSGARVNGRDAIARSDCYDDLIFASGDGVCLAREAMLPAGYQCVQGGRISTDRGHVTLLGDLNAVGRAIEAVVKGRAKGLGLGAEYLASSRGHARGKSC